MPTQEQLLATPISASTMASSAFSYAQNNKVPAGEMNGLSLNNQFMVGQVLNPK